MTTTLTSATNTDGESVFSRIYVPKDNTVYINA